MNLIDPLYEKFRNLLVSLAGLDYGPTKRDLLVSRLRERMQATDCADFAAYYALITGNDPHRDAERQLLFQSLTVGETCFFRNQEHFATLREHALPELLSLRAAERRLKLWSAGCASGEEPYSLAIAIREAMSAQLQAGWRLDILATDLNQAAIQRAQYGHYGRRAMREVGGEMRMRYFTAEPPNTADPHNFIINPQIKQQVKFAYFNLASFPYNLQLVGNCDVIFCENVMIYFAAPVIRQVIDALYRCLRPGGYLFLGYAETLWHIPHSFELISLPNTFCYRRPTLETTATPRPPTMVRRGSGSLRLGTPAEAPAPRRHIGTLPRTAHPRPPTGPLPTQQPVAALPAPTIGKGAGGEGVPERSPAEWCAEADRLITAGKYDEATTAYQNALNENPQQVEAICGLARIHANRGLQDLAVSECLRAIAVDALYIEAHLLMGIIYAQDETMTGRIKAIEAFRKAVYVEPTVVAPHFYLGELHRQMANDKSQHVTQRRNNHATALQEYEIAERLLKRLPRGSQVEGLPPETLLRVCELNISALKER